MTPGSIAISISYTLGGASAGSPRARARQTTCHRRRGELKLFGGLYAHFQGLGWAGVRLWDAGVRWRTAGSTVEAIGCYNHFSGDIIRTSGVDGPPRQTRGK